MLRSSDGLQRFEILPSNAFQWMHMEVSADPRDSEDGQLAIPNRDKNMLLNNAFIRKSMKETQKESWNIEGM